MMCYNTKQHFLASLCSKIQSELTKNAFILSIILLNSRDSWPIMLKLDDG